MQKLPSVRIFPRKVFTELDDRNLYLNFDFEFTGCGIDFSILSISLLVYDSRDRVILRRFLRSDGVSPSILTIPERSIPSEGKVGIFNPFERFNSHLRIAKLYYIFELGTEGKVAKLHVEVPTFRYVQQVDLILPFEGCAMVSDAHDYLSNHRRVPLSHPKIKGVGIESNSGRYAYDFCMTDTKGNPLRNVPRNNNDFLSFGSLVYSPGDGVIVDSRDEITDNPLKSNICSELFASPGNYVIIDHGNSEFSVLAHLKKDSVIVNIDDTIMQGQLIGKIGNSGSSAVPHLHYHLQNGVNTLSSEGLPCMFRDYWWLLGNKYIFVKKGSPKTGEIVTTDESIVSVSD